MTDEQDFSCLLTLVFFLLFTSGCGEKTQDRKFLCAALCVHACGQDVGGATEPGS